MSQTEQVPTSNPTCGCGGQAATGGRAEAAAGGRAEAAAGERPQLGLKAAEAAGGCGCGRH